MMVAKILVVSLAVLHLLLTVATQFRIASISKHDKTLLLPNWTFFAPKPGCIDYHLFFRYKSENGSLSPWYEQAVTHERKLIHAIWNPGKRLSKIFYDCTSEIIMYVSSGFTNEQIQMTLGYLMVLDLLTNHFGNDEHPYIQFSIIESAGYEATDKPRKIFVSNFHRI